MSGEKLKIAVQLYGHLRTFRECAPALKEHFLDHYDCDVFIHTWDTLDHTTKAWHKLNEGKEVIELNTDDIKKELQQLYNPQGIIIETQEKTDLGNITDNYGQVYSIFAIRCMMQTMKKSNSLRMAYQNENNKKYDYVLCTRPDVFLKEPFVLEKYISRFTETELNKSIYITGMKCDADSPILNDLRYYGGKDLLFFARPEIIANLYDNEDRVFDDVLNVMKDKILLSIIEYFFYQMLMYSGCKILICDYVLCKNYDIKRLS